MSEGWLEIAPVEESWPISTSGRWVAWIVTPPSRPVPAVVADTADDAVAELGRMVGFDGICWVCIEKAQIGGGGIHPAQSCPTIGVKVGGKTTRVCEQCADMVAEGITADEVLEAAAVLVKSEYLFADTPIAAIWAAAPDRADREQLVRRASDALHELVPDWIIKSWPDYDEGEARADQASWLRTAASAWYNSVLMDRQQLVARAYVALDEYIAINPVAELKALREKAAVWDNSLQAARCAWLTLQDLRRRATEDRSRPQHRR